MRPLFLSGLLTLAACTTGPEIQTPAPTPPSGTATAPVTVGAFASGTAITVDDALARSASLDGQEVRVAGVIRQVCQAKGCWLTFSTGQGQTLRVMTHEEGADEDESVVFPMDAAGRRAEVIGTLRVAEESVARRRHLAEDAGASAEEIAAITEPTRAVSLFATGARID